MENGQEVNREAKRAGVVHTAKNHRVPRSILQTSKKSFGSWQTTYQTRLGLLSLSPPNQPFLQRILSKPVKINALRVPKTLWLGPSQLDQQLVLSLLVISASLSCCSHCIRSRLDRSIVQTSTKPGSLAPSVSGVWRANKDIALQRPERERAIQ